MHVCGAGGDRWRSQRNNLSLAELSSREMTFCHECGAKIAPDDPFCGNCGAAQVSAPAASSTIITGGHAYDTAAFPKLFEGYEDIKPTFVALKGYTEIFEDIKDWKYDVIVFAPVCSRLPANVIRLSENMP